MTATFENTVDILVKAYLNNELEHGDCMACAVGNIVKACYGKFYASPLWTEGGKVVHPGYGWSSVFCTVAPAYQVIQPQRYVGSAKEQIDSTGYSRQYLQLIEAAFESCNPSGSIADEDEAMFNGLMAVVDVLAEIHNVDLSVKENAKSLFVKV